MKKQGFFVGLIKKWNHMSSSAKASVYIWFVCLVLLFVFVGMALWWQDVKTGLSANLVAAFAGIFVLLLFAALLFTVIPQVWGNKKGRK